MFCWQHYRQAKNCICSQFVSPDFFRIILRETMKRKSHDFLTDRVNSVFLHVDVSSVRKPWNFFFMCFWGWSWSNIWTTRASVSPGYPNTRKQCMKTRGRRPLLIVWISRWDTSSSCLNSFSNESERCCEKSVCTSRGINLEKCVFSGCNITFVVDDKTWITK